METVFTELDCEQVRDVTVISRNGSKEQRIFLNREGVFRFSDQDNGAINVMRLPFIKVWTFCSLISDMLNIEEEELFEQNESWEVVARDNFGRRFRAKGYATTFTRRPKYDPSKYLREVTGINRMWLLDGMKAV